MQNCEDRETKAKVGRGGKEITVGTKIRKGGVR
jgi:hypothetical protein